MGDHTGRGDCNLSVKSREGDENKMHMVTSRVVSGCKHKSYRGNEKCHKDGPGGSSGKGESSSKSRSNQVESGRIEANRTQFQCKDNAPVWVLSIWEGRISATASTLYNIKKEKKGSATQTLPHRLIF